MQKSQRFNAPFAGISVLKFNARSLGYRCPESKVQCPVRWDIGALSELCFCDGAQREMRIQRGKQSPCQTGLKGCHCCYYSTASSFSFGGTCSTPMRRIDLLGCQDSTLPSVLSSVSNNEPPPLTHPSNRRLRYDMPLVKKVNI